MVKKAFEKIAKGLNEALAFARREARQKEDSNVIHMSKHEWDKFTATLGNAPLANAKLKALLKRNQIVRGGHYE